MGEWDISTEDWRQTTPSSTRPSVLIVDDDYTVRSMLSFVFEDDGFDVTEAVDGVDALGILAADPPDAMVLDLMMPNVDGHGVLRTRREQGLAPDCRILVLTAKSDASDAVWCWRLGADEYLNKPVEPERLLREVHLLLQRSPEDARDRREIGLREAERMDAMEAAFDAKRRRR